MASLRLRRRTTAVTGRPPKTLISKPTSSAAPVHGIVRSQTIVGDCEHGKEVCRFGFTNRHLALASGIRPSANRATVVGSPVFPIRRLMSHLILASPDTRTTVRHIYRRQHVAQLRSSRGANHLEEYVVGRCVRSLLVLQHPDRTLRRSEDRRCPPELQFAQICRCTTPMRKRKK